MYHTYVDWTTDERPFYVGMGDDRRLSRRFGRNKRHTHVAKKYGSNRRIAASFPDRQDAIELEVKLIAEYHTFVDDPLYNGLGCNYTKGGEGCPCSEETRRKISRSKMDRSPWNKGKRGKPLSETQKQRLREVNLGRLPTIGMTGKKHGEATREKMWKPHRCSSCGVLGHTKTTCSL